MTWDRVYTIHDYHDGPRLGMADVDGMPHIYELKFDDNADEYGDTYFVSPVDDDLLSLVLEGWDIWLRWDAAFKRGETSIKSHPALPEDRDRHDALKIAIGDRFRVDRARAKQLKARFQTSPETRETVVMWSPA